MIKIYYSSYKKNLLLKEVALELKQNGIEFLCGVLDFMYVT